MVGLSSHSEGWPNRGVLPGEGSGVVEDKQVLGGAGKGRRAGQLP